MAKFGSTAHSEWRQYWTLPVAAMIGYSATGIHVQSLGPFIEPLQQEFGWSRSLISSGLTTSSLIGSALSIPVGMLVDRFGPRPLALMGLVLITAAFALFGTTTGATAQWIQLWIVLGFAHLLMQPTVWIKAVATRFERSRGFAFAITLCGAGIGSAVFPILATWLIGSFGWRTAYPAMGGIWLAITFPFVLLFFHAAPNQTPHTRAAEPSAFAVQGLTVAQALRSPAFYKLLIATGLFAFTLGGIVIHFVPILTHSGADPLRAAGIASLIGIFSIIGRLVTGLLLDRFPGHVVGAGVFMLPIIGSTLLLFDSSDPISQGTAAACFGFTLGAEIDVIAYLTTRYMGLKHYGVLFGAMVGALTLGMAFGPLAAGAAYDWYGSYRAFINMTLVASLVSCLALVTLGRPRLDSLHAPP